MKILILLLFLGVHAVAHGPAGVVTGDNSRIHTIMKTFYHTVVRRDEPKFARAERMTAFPAIASVFPWPNPGIKSRRNREADPAQLTKSTLHLHLESSQQRRHDEAPLSNMTTAFSWPSAGIISGSTTKTHATQPGGIIPTPTHVDSGIYDRDNKGHEPTISQLPVTGAAIVFNKPKSYFSHRAMDLPLDSRDRRAADLFNLTLILPRSPGYISIHISDILAIPFCKRVPEETREDKNDSKLDGSRRFYDLELGIGIGLSKIPVRQDYAIEFCRTVKVEHESSHAPKKAEASPEKTTMPKTNLKATAATVTESASMIPKPSGAQFPKAKSSYAKSSNDSLATSKTKARVTATKAAGDEPESPKASAKVKVSHVDSTTEDGMRGKAKAKTTTVVLLEGTSDTSKATKLKTNSAHVESEINTLAPSKILAKPSATGSPDGTFDVADVSSHMYLESKFSTVEPTTKDAIKGPEPILTSAKFIATESTESQLPSTVPIKNTPSSSRILVSTQSTNFMDQTVSTNEPTDLASPSLVHSAYVTKTTSDTSTKPPSRAQPGVSAMKLVPITGIVSSITAVQTTGSEVVASDDVSSTLSKDSAGISINTKSTPTTSAVYTTDSSFSSTQTTSFQAQALYLRTRDRSFLVSSMNSWYGSINNYLRTAKPTEDSTTMGTDSPNTSPITIPNTPTASMTTLSSIQRREDAPVLTVSSMNSWYGSINDYLKTATAATQAMSAHPSSNAAMKRASMFGLWRRARPAGEPPAVAVRRRQREIKAEGTSESEVDNLSDEAIEQDTVHTADETLDAAVNDNQDPAVEEVPVDDNSEAPGEEEDPPEEEDQLEDESTTPDTDVPADDPPTPSEQEHESDIAQPTTTVDENLPPLELLKTEQPTGTDGAVEDAAETGFTTRIRPTGTKKPGPTPTHEDEEAEATSSDNAEPDADAEGNGKDEQHGAHGKQTATSTPSPTPARTLVWDPACTAPPPSNAKASSKGCWTLVDMPVNHTSTGNLAEHDSLSTAWGAIKAKEIVWTVMLGWTLLGLEVFVGLWEFVRGVRGDAEVGRRVVGLWVR